MSAVCGIAERFAESVRPALGPNAAKKLCRMLDIGQRRAEQLLSPSDPRPPTAEQIAIAGRVFGDGWVRFVLFGGDETGARARLEARMQALQAQIDLTREQIDRLKGR